MLSAAHLPGDLDALSQAAAWMSGLLPCRLLDARDGCAAMRLQRHDRPEMFRWCCPLSKRKPRSSNVIYHWDGPAARVHTSDLIAAWAAYLSYVPATPRRSIDHIELHNACRLAQGVQVWGTPIRSSGCTASCGRIRSATSPARRHPTSRRAAGMVRNEHVRFRGHRRRAEYKLRY